jgi:hypothetical protein
VVPGLYRGGKTLLLFSIAALILIGLGYAIGVGQEIKDQSQLNTSLMQLVPEKCKIVDLSDGIDASIEFRRDETGNIVDRSYVRLLADNVYAGANVSYRIVVKNISTIPISVDGCTLSINNNSDSLADSLYFSGSIMIYRSDNEYYDIIGTFKNVGITELADHITNIMKYRKIDITEELVIELDHQFDGDERRLVLDGSLSYELMPVFVQYFPTENVDLTGDQI